MKNILEAIGAAIVAVIFVIIVLLAIILIVVNLFTLSKPEPDWLEGLNKFGCLIGAFATLIINYVANGKDEKDIEKAAKAVEEN